MAKILLGISILLTLLTGVLGFMTKGKVDELQGTLKTTTSGLNSAKSSLAKSQSDLKKTQEDLTAAAATILDREKEITKQKGDMDEVNTKLTAATAAVEAKAAEVAQISARMKEMEGKLGTVNPEEMVTKLNQLTADLGKAQTELAEAKQVQETLNARVSEAEGKATASEQKVKEYQGPITRRGLSGRVLAYNQGWNFVVINIGDRAGVKSNTQMLVLRGNQPIAKVKVTSVEPATSIADVVPNSMARGETLQPGDTVVYAEQR